MKNTLRVLIAVVLVVTMVWFVPGGAPEDVKAYVGWAGAGGSPYIGATNPQPMDINASRNTGNSHLVGDRCLVLDSQGNPHIAWRDYTPGNWDIYYVHWDGTDWLCADGSVYDPTIVPPAVNPANVSDNGGHSYYPSLAIDGGGNPHIAWYDRTPGTPDIYYVRWGGSNWLCTDGSVYNSTANPNPANVSDNVGNSSIPSLTIDSGGNPHIAWQDAPLDFMGFPGPPDIYYVRWDGTDWLCADGSVYDPTIVPPAVNPANMSDNVDYSYNPSLAIDGGGNPHIAWFDYTPRNHDIYYVRWNGTDWLCADGSVYNPTANPNPANVSDNAGNSRYPSLAIDGGGNPHIAWQDYTPGNWDIYYVRWDGTDWLCAGGCMYAPPNTANVSDNAGDSWNPSLAIDGGGNPHIAWWDRTPGTPDIYYVRWGGSNWLCTDGSVYNSTANPNPANVSDNAGDSWDPSLAIDSGGNPHIAWKDTTPGNYDIYYVRWLNNFEGTFTLSKGVDTNSDSVFVDGNEIISNGDTLTYQINWDYLSGTDPIFDGYLYDSIPFGTTYVAGSATPTATLEYSQDFGTTWIPGEPPVNAPGGTMLRWAVPTISPASMTVQFSVLVVDADITAVNNGAIFSHRYDDGNFLASNTISNTTITCENCPECPECPECPDINSPYLEITKTAESMHYYEDDIFSFKARVSNLGGKQATDVIISDIFPREMKMIASRPKGAISKSGWKMLIGTLPPGAARSFEFMFRLDEGVHIGEQPLSLTNIATASCDELESVTDNATIVVRNTVGTETLSLFTQWKGINTKTFEGSTGEEITLEMKASGGSSPYNISVNWDDGEVTKFYDVTGDTFKEALHTFSSSGEYEVIIKVVDQYGKTVLSWVTLTIK